MLTYPSELRRRVIIFATSPHEVIDLILCRQTVFYLTTPKRDNYGIALDEDGIATALVDGLVHDMTQPGLDFFDRHIGDPTFSAPLYEHLEYSQTHGQI
ncbi:MAG: hypothetical protein Q8K75_04385 [Chlamydiales bacterium]|nr:hypothetical protein [Chlamydiales bacterium]